jgi:hypothetical protein
VGGGKVYFPAIGAGIACAVNCPGGSFASDAMWTWDEDDVGNGEGGYTFHGHVYPDTPAGVRFEEAVSCLDEVNDQILTVISTGMQDSGTHDPNVKIDTNTDAASLVVEYPNVGGSTNGYDEPFGCAFITSLGVAAIFTDSNNLKTAPASTLAAWTARPITGTFGVSEVRTVHAVYSPAADQVFTRQHGDGNSIRCLTVPATVSGTWSASTCAAVSGGENVPDVNQASDAGGYSRQLNIIQDFMGTGCDMLLYWPAINGPVYFRKVCAPIASAVELLTPANDAYYDQRMAA